MASGKRRRGRHRGVSGKANSDLMTHVASLGLDTIRLYQDWCRDHGFSGALNKSWQERRAERALATKLSKRSAADEALRHHLRRLGIESEKAYQLWCREHGLSESTNKSAQQRKKEIELHVQLAGEDALTRRRKQSRRPRDTIEQIFAGEVASDSLRTPYLRKIQATLDAMGKTPEGRAAFRVLLLNAEQHADHMLGVKPAIPRLGPQDGNTYIEAFASLARYQDEWINTVQSWQPDTHNARRQFGSLVRHLLARYDVPAFMDSAWFLGDPDEARRQQRWFVHVGMGQNIRKADVPVQLTKKMAHLFLNAPGDYTTAEAFRLGQILGLGGEMPLVRAVNATQLGSSFEREDFWKTVVHFFVNNPMLDPGQIGPIVDYIHNQKFVPQEIAQPGGEVEHRPPAQPNFAMKGRSAAKLVRQVEAWHRQLSRESRLPHQRWEPSGLQPFALTEEPPALGMEIQWSIRELLTTRELQAEGRSLGHCVASYANNCRKGSCSIWSMQVSAEGGTSRRVMTVAVNNQSTTVTQARGRSNALPSGKTPGGGRPGFEKRYAYFLRQSKRILSLWRQQEGLSMSHKA